MLLKSKFKSKKLLISLIIVFPLIALIPISHILAQSDPNVSDLQSQIDQKTSEINQLNQSIGSLKSQVQSYLNQESSLSQNYYNVQSNINLIQSKINQEKTLISQLSSLVAQRKQQIGSLIDQKNTLVKELYMTYQINPVQLMFSSENLSSVMNEYVLDESQINKYISDISSLNDQINQANTNISNLNNDENNLNSQISALDTQRSTLANEIYAVRGNISNANGSINSQTNTISSLNQQINGLNAEIQQIQALAAAKAAVAKNSGNTDQGYTGSNGYIFTSKGWGTYVGMPQYGAYGMAAHGFSAQQIASHYYAGSSVLTSSGTDNTNVYVQGYGQMTMGQYLSGIGEVPDYWPTEAVKAQIIVSRSYAYYAYKFGGKGTSNNPFPTNTSFQVYDGANPNRKQSFVSATTDEILSINGQDPIDALFYSSAGGYTLTPTCAWNWTSSNCSGATDPNYSYLSSVSDTYDLPQCTYPAGTVDVPFDSNLPSPTNSPCDPVASVSTPERSPQQVANILNSALLLCVNTSSCYFNNYNGQYVNTIINDNKLHSNEDPSNGQSYTNNFPNVEAALANNNIKIIGHLQAIKVSYVGSAQVPISLTAYSDNYPGGVTIDAGIFFRAFNLSSPDADELYGMRYYIN